MSSICVPLSQVKTYRRKMPPVQAPAPTARDFPIIPSYLLCLPQAPPLPSLCAPHRSGPPPPTSSAHRQLPLPPIFLSPQQGEADRLRLMEDLDRMEASSARERLPVPSDFRRLCFRATDIVHYVSTELPGRMLTSGELCRHARAAGLYYAEQMYRLGYPFTTQLSEAIALTYTWSSPIPHALQVRVCTLGCKRYTRLPMRWLSSHPTLWPALQYIYDMSCRDRFHYYAVNPAEAVIFKANSSVSENGPPGAAAGPASSQAAILKTSSGGAVSEADPAASVIGSEDEDGSGWGWVIPCRFVWLDIVNVNQNSRDIVAELSILPEIYGSASRHVIAGFDCFSRGWCLFEIAMRNQALVQSEDPKVRGGRN